MASRNRYSSDQTTAMNESEDDEEMMRIMKESIQKSQLTREQCYRLGGAEYRALELLTVIVPSFYFSFTVGFGLLIRMYIASSPFAQEVLTSSTVKGIPMDPWVFSFFLSLSIVYWSIRNTI